MSRPQALQDFLDVALPAMRARAPNAVHAMRSGNEPLFAPWALRGLIEPAVKRDPVALQR